MKTPTPKNFQVPGFKASGIACGLKKNGAKDLALILSATPAVAAGVFTKNRVLAASVILSRRTVKKAHPIRAIVINSGNANAGTGEPGLQDAQRSCLALAEKTGCTAEQVLPFSTGVIGERLPVPRIEAALDTALTGLSGTGWQAAAQAIMTTDTVAKGVSKTLTIDGRHITLTGIVKGAGMIRPDMATMLAFIACDAALEEDALQQCLSQAVQHSFNRITVDGDTSTNDACVLVATGATGAVPMAASHAGFTDFCAAVSELCVQLAQLIVRDAEGATKFVTILVEQGRDAAECLRVAYTVAHSPLVKTALFASDPNWGRILAAVGRAGVEALDIERISMFLGEVCIVRNGGVADDYREQNGQRVMQDEEISIRIQLGRGDASEQVWTSDLSHDYVRINAEYRS